MTHKVSDSKGSVHTYLQTVCQSYSLTYLVNGDSFSTGSIAIRAPSHRASVMANSHCTRPGQGQEPGQGNDGFLYCGMYSTLHRDRVPLPFIVLFLVPRAIRLLRARYFEGTCEQTSMAHSHGATVTASMLIF